MTIEPKFMEAVSCPYCGATRSFEFSHNTVERSGVFKCYSDHEQDIIGCGRDFVVYWHWEMCYDAHKIEGQV